MDSLVPPLLTAVREIRWHLQAGRSIKESINTYLSAHSDEFTVRLHELWSLKVQGHTLSSPVFRSHRAQALWDLIERAYLGQPIAEPLALLEDDIEATAGSDLDMHVAALPFKALAPLLLFQFPAFAMLLIGPLLRELSRFSLIFVLSVLVAEQISAETLSSAAFRKIARTRNVKDLDRVKFDFEELRVLRMACDLQLKEKTVPAACYKALVLEQKWGLSTKSSASSIRARIDRRCLEAADKFQGLDGRLPAEVSAVCRTSVAKAKELRSYQQLDWQGT